MSKTNHRLGMGLDALIPQRTIHAVTVVEQLDIQNIKPSSFQPRVHFDSEALKELAQSIQNNGLAQPIIVRKVADYYELVAGERRLRACLSLNKEKIPAIVKDYSDKEALQIALIENLQRENLNAIEVANGYQRLIDEFSLTHDQISDVFAKSRSTVTNTLRLLSLPQSVQAHVQNDDLSEGHARTLLFLDSADHIDHCANIIIKDRLNVRDTERLVQQFKPEKADKRKRDYSFQLPLFEDLRQQIEASLQTKVRVHVNKRTGKIEIPFKSQVEFQRIAQAILD